MGNTPIRMEDKWFIFQDENKIRFFRSWTGIEFYQGELRKRSENKWIFDRFRTQLDDNEMEVSMFKKFLSAYLESRIKIMK